MIELPNHKANKKARVRWQTAVNLVRVARIPLGTQEAKALYGTTAMTA